MITAILYTTNTGTTERYAKMLGDKLRLPVCPLADSTFPEGSEILYLGWVMASGIKGYKRANRKYKIKAVCAVCMGATGSQLNELRQANAIPDGIALFSLQGGFHMEKLRGIYKFMMKVMGKTLGKALADKPDRTSEENDMLEMMLHGGDRVSQENLADLLAWLEEQG